MLNCILIINNEINEIKVKNLIDDTIYRKCNYKNNKDFYKIKTWDVENNTIELWGKSKGLSNTLSEFELFKTNSINVYGKSIFVMKNNNNFVSLNRDKFLDIFKLINTKIVSVLTEDNIKNNDNNDNNDNIEDDDKSEYSINSELSYEIYEYSSDEN
tara:strand:+ start:302 stop:772 length:471 start_codon:yes stop_codon:yes gene_type:complete